MTETRLGSLNPVVWQKSVESKLAQCNFHEAGKFVIGEAPPALWTAGARDHG
jgi:hypothetical protein